MFLKIWIRARIQNHIQQKARVHPLTNEDCADLQQKFHYALATSCNLEDAPTLALVSNMSGPLKFLLHPMDLGSSRSHTSSLSNPEHEQNFNKNFRQ